MEDEECGGGMSKYLAWNNKYRRDRFGVQGVGKWRKISSFLGVWLEWLVEGFRRDIWEPAGERGLSLRHLALKSALPFGPGWIWESYCLVSILILFPLGKLLCDSVASSVSFLHLKPRPALL